MTRTEARMPSATRQPGAAVLVALAVACVLTDGMAIATLLGLNFLRMGYTEAGDLGVSGWRISGVPKLLLLLSFVAWALWLALLSYRVLWRRKPALRRACRWGAGLSLLAVLLAPGWVDLQIQHYHGPGQSTELMVGNSLLPAAAWITKSDREEGPDGSSISGTTYVCRQSSRLKFLGLEWRSSFYPSLDEKHGAELMQAHCRTLPGAAS